MMNLARSIIFLLALFSVGTQANGVTCHTVQKHHLTGVAIIQNKCHYLVLASPVNRELQPGDTACYQVHVEGGQYFRVVVMQEGIDVAVKLLSPEGKEIIDVDSPNSRFGPEPISAIAESTGLYQLQIRALDAKAIAGRYEISLEQLRAPSDSDRQRIMVEAILVEAEHLRAQKTNESLHQALERYDKALPILRSIGDREKEAKTFSAMASVYYLLGEMPKDRPKAYDYLNRALTLAHEMKDRDLESDALTFLGELSVRYGEPQKALEYYRQAVQVEHEVGNKSMEGRTVKALAATYWSLGESEKALQSYDRSLVLLRLAGNHLDEAYALAEVGLVYIALGEPETALANAQKSLIVARRIGNKPAERYALRIEARAHLDLKEPKKALDSLNLALASKNLNDDKSNHAEVLSDLAMVQVRLGNNAEAVTLLEKALDIQRSIDDQLGAAYSLSRMGAIYITMGKVEAAVPILEQALTIQRAGVDRGNEALTCYRLAQAEQKRGRLETARTYIEAAVKIIDEIRNQLFDQDLKTSWWANRRSYYEFYIDVLMEMDGHDPHLGCQALAFQVSERTRARSFLETLIESRAQIRSGVDPVLLEAEQSTQQRLNAKAESLMRLLNGNHTAEQERDARGEVEDLLSLYKEIEARIRAESPRYAALTQPATISVESIQKTLLDAQTILVEYTFGEERSYAFVVSNTSITSYQLPKRKEIETSARRVHDLLASKGDLLEPGALTELSGMILAPMAKDLVGKRLLIVADGVLQYIPFGALPDPNVHPITAGPKTPATGWTYEPLINGHEIVNLPSASVAVVQREQIDSRARATKKLIVFADPVFGRDDQRVSGAQPVIGGQRSHKTEPPPADQLNNASLIRAAEDVTMGELRRLPMSRREAEYITARIPKTLALKAVDFNANLTSATDPELSQYQIVHFATHSILNNRHPELSGIVLSLVNSTGQPQDGFLRLNQIYNLQLNSDLVVLSACQTALGKEIKGEGLVGLTRGFMYAGTPRVVASVWKVEDGATAELMRRFYKHMLDEGKRPAAALRAAQISLRSEKQWRAPYYWAGFVLQGDWK